MGVSQLRQPKTVGLRLAVVRLSAEQGSYAVGLRPADVRLSAEQGSYARIQKQDVPRNS